MRIHPDWFIGFPILIMSIFLPLSVLAQPVQEQSGNNPLMQNIPVQDLPVTRVALFSSGVCYFEHRGLVHSDAVLYLPFRTTEVDDVLKSLVVWDLGGGQAGSPSVSYPSLETLDQSLESFRVDLSGNPDIAELLGRLRGVELVVDPPESISGRIVTIEKRPAGQDGISRPWLVLATRDGIRSISIDGMVSFRFVDLRISDDFDKALALILGAKDADRRSIKDAARNRHQRQCGSLCDCRAGVEGFLQT